MNVPRLEKPCIETVAITTHTRTKSAIGNITAKKVFPTFPSKWGSNGFAHSADPKVLSPKPNIDESTSSMTEILRLAASSRGNPMIARG